MYTDWNELDDQGSIPSILLSGGNQVLVPPGLNWLGHEADYLPPSNVKVNIW
jgi:hypothetical protein